MIEHVSDGEIKIAVAFDQNAQTRSHSLWIMLNILAYTKVKLLGWWDLMQACHWLQPQRQPLSKTGNNKASYWKNLVVGNLCNIRQI